MERRASLSVVDIYYLCVEAWFMNNHIHKNEGYTGEGAG